MVDGAALYTSDEYVTKNPTLFEEHAEWKVSKITPLIDQFLIASDWRDITVLDIGGGSGRILQLVCDRIKQCAGFSPNKIALDLSPRALSLQVQTNPDIVKTLNEDATETTLRPKEADLALMIDVLEHIPDPAKALRELSRVSKYAILKVPLDDTLIFRMSDIMRNGESKRRLIEGGHVNLFTSGRIRKLVESECGHIEQCQFTNNCLRSLSERRGSYRDAFSCLGGAASTIWPTLSSRIFYDFWVALVECR